MGVRATISSSFGYEADRICFLDPLFWCKREAIEAGLFSKPVEFDGFKIWIMEQYLSNNGQSPSEWDFRLGPLIMFLSLSQEL